MIPLHLKLSGFLSYRDPVDLDFSGFDLACISGSNGAGKSSLLDAITWALFGQARKRDEAVVNLQSKAAEVAFTFAYETNVYRVIRSLARGKTTMLEFQIQQPVEVGQPVEWRPLTERTGRDTQARIEQILRLDYDTFVNVSFFLQGRADQFAQQPPTRRKEILGAILGLEAWEIYRERAAERRKGDRTRRSIRWTGAWPRSTPSWVRRKPASSTWPSWKASSGDWQPAARCRRRCWRMSSRCGRPWTNNASWSANWARPWNAPRPVLAAPRHGWLLKETERSSHADLVRRAAEVEAAYTALREARLDLEKWEQVADRFREHDQQRQPLVREIETERARLEQERTGLEVQRKTLDNQAAAAIGYQEELSAAKKALDLAEASLTERSRLEKQIQESREKQAGLRAENAGLKTEMDELKSRIDKLTAAEGAVCPLCGQSLSDEHRQSTLDQLNLQGRQLGDRYRLNQSTMEELAGQVRESEAQLTGYATADADRLSASSTLSQMTERLENYHKQSGEWEQNSAKRLAEVTKLLEKEKFATEARKRLASVDKELAALGYDAAAHDAARRAEVQARPAEAEYRELESARAALKPLDDEIANLGSTISSQQAAVSAQQVEYDQTFKALSDSEDQAPDLDAAEQSLFDLQERENQLNQEVGGARQKVTVLDDLRRRKKKLETERGELGLLIGRYKALERAFGKDGVPALLIEQALPEIEMKANEILGRLSDDSMHLHFETQARYKDEKRKDLRETLEIQVSDGAGLRDYEMYSGGEAFRVNFAIRLALSEVLAQRKGARLQMLVIDEGFGSQDTLGRQRLIQAINAVKGDFAKILVITHLEELKDAFPTRIEVEKGEGGSEVRVI